jgi:tol-pal system protein YbgF
MGEGRGMSEQVIRSDKDMQRLILVLMAAILVSGVGVKPAHAQAIEKRIERLEKQVRALQRKVFDGRDVAMPADGADDMGTASPAVAVGTEQRIMALEEQLRSLTGQIEQVQFQASQTQEKLDTFMADTEFRFGQLEGGGTTGGGAAAASKTPATTAASVATEPNELPEAASGSSAAGASSDAALPAGSPMEQYNHAYSLLAQGKYEAAEAAFRSFLAVHGTDALAGNAQYWLGQSLFVRGNYNDAAREFVAGYQTYPNSQKAPAYLLKIGISLAKIGQKQEACDVFAELKSRYPNSPESKERRPAEEKAAGC